MNTCLIICDEKGHILIARKMSVVSFNDLLISSTRRKDH